MKKHYPVIVEQDEDGVFIVSCPVFRGCHSYGHTIDEAISNVLEAIEVCRDEEGGHSTTTFIGVRDLELAS